MSILKYTSYFILSPAIVGAYLGLWPDVLLTTSHTIISAYYHSTYSPTLLIVDRTALLLVLLRCLWLSLYTYTTICIGIVSFTYLGTIYVYGYKNKCFAFHPDIRIGDRYHASMHLFCSLLYASGLLILFY